MIKRVWAHSVEKDSICLAEIGARMLHGASVCVFWVEMGACFVLIRQHGGHACSRESILAGSRHQLSYLASSNRVPTATWHAANSADSQHNRSGVFQTRELWFTCSQTGSVPSTVLGGWCLICFKLKLFPLSLYKSKIGCYLLLPWFPRQKA